MGLNRCTTREVYPESLHAYRNKSAHEVAIYFQDKVPIPALKSHLAKFIAHKHIFM